MAYQTEGMDYYVYCPPGHPPPGGWPVLLFTHGIGEATNTYSPKHGWREQLLEAVKQHGSPPSLCEAKPPRAATLFNSFVVISPQFPFVPDDPQRAHGSRPWQWANRLGTIRTILGTVTANFDANSHRIFATGFSRGGTGAMAIATDRDSRFAIAKLVLVDSETDPTAAQHIPTWAHFAGPRTFGNIVTAHEGLIRRVAQGIWQNVPAGGTAVPSGRLLFTDWNVDTGNGTRNHTDTSTLAYSDSRIYEWLLQ
jgi:predicted peptidase